MSIGVKEKPSAWEVYIFKILAWVNLHKPNRLIEIVGVFLTKESKLIFQDYWLGKAYLHGPIKKLKA